MQDDIHHRQIVAHDPRPHGSAYCGWCQFASGVEAALAALADRDAADILTRDGALTWIFHPPQDVAAVYWATVEPDDRAGCELQDP